MSTSFKTRARFRRMNPNSGYGFRISKTLNNPRVWYDANAFSGRCLFALGVMTSLVSLVLFFIPAIGDLAYSLICQAIILLGIAASVFLSFRYVDNVTKP